jgi:tRNA (guanine-N7-)-methyltransferase
MDEDKGVLPAKLDLATWGPNRSYGRIKSRTLKPRQADLMQSLLPRLYLDAARLKTLLAEPDLRLWLEIGFGAGEHLAAQASLHPDVRFIGCEPFLNGVGALLSHIDNEGLDNISLLPSDVRPLLSALPEACLERVFIMFPDPWPKLRHHKRRLIQAQIVDELARVMRPQGILRFATDWADYADWTLERFLAANFIWPANTPQAWLRPPVDHVTTRYEQKRLGDCEPVFFDFYKA